MGNGINFSKRSRQFQVCKIGSGNKDYCHIHDVYAYVYDSFLARNILDETRCLARAEHGGQCGLRPGKFAVCKRWHQAKLLELIATAKAQMRVEIAIAEERFCPLHIQSEELVQCRAIAKTTKKQCTRRCSREYCWQHDIQIIIPTTFTDVSPDSSSIPSPWSVESTEQLIPNKLTSPASICHKVQDLVVNPKKVAWWMKWVQEMAQDVLRMGMISSVELLSV